MIPRPYTREGGPECDAWLIQPGAFERAVANVFAQHRLAGLPLAPGSFCMVELCFVVEGPTCFVPPRPVRFNASVRLGEGGAVLIPDADRQRAEAVALLRRSRLSILNSGR